MQRPTTFAATESGVLPKFTHAMEHSRSVADVRKYFVYAMLEVLNAVLDGQVELAYEDISLAPHAPGYVLSSRLAEHPVFSALRQTSDIDAILARFAAASATRANAFAEA